VSAKARDLIAPALGPGKADKLIERVDTLEKVDDIRLLCSLLIP
jgi:hypothetical protein